MLSILSSLQCSGRVKIAVNIHTLSLFVLSFGVVGPPPDMVFLDTRTVAGRTQKKKRHHVGYWDDQRLQ